MLRRNRAFIQPFVHSALFSLLFSILLTVKSELISLILISVSPRQKKINSSCQLSPQFISWKLVQVVKTFQFVFACLFLVLWDWQWFHEPFFCHCQGDPGTFAYGGSNIHTILCLWDLRCENILGQTPVYRIPVRKLLPCKVGSCTKHAKHTAHSPIFSFHAPYL